MYESIDTIWDRLVKDANGNGIPNAKDLKENIKNTKSFMDRREKLLDYYFHKIHVAFVEGQLGTIVDLAEAGCIIDKLIIATVQKELELKGYKFIEIDQTKFMIRWD